MAVQQAENNTIEGNVSYLMKLWQTLGCNLVMKDMILPKKA